MTTHTAAIEARLTTLLTEHRAAILREAAATIPTTFTDGDTPSAWLTRHATTPHPNPTPTPNPDPSSGPTPADPGRVDEIRARVHAATTGTWQWSPYGAAGRTLLAIHDAPPGLATHPATLVKTIDHWSPEPADETFIAHARDDIFHLLTLLDTHTENPPQ